MARAIVRNPRLFLMDEPLSNLDARLRSEVRQHYGPPPAVKTSTVYATSHDQTEAMSMADRIVVMNGGHVQQVGRPVSVCQPGQSVRGRIYRFTGNESAIAPCVDGNVHGELRHPLPPRHRSQTRVWLGIRPEHITDRVEQGHLPAGHRPATRTDGSRLSAPRQHADRHPAL